MARDARADRARRHGPDALGFLASAKCTNEENYLVQKLARQGFGTNNVDHCARLCHAPTVVALGRGPRLGRDDELDGRHRAAGPERLRHRLQHDRAAPRPRACACRAAQASGGSRSSWPTRAASRSARPPRSICRCGPGTDIALLNGLAHVLIANGWVDPGFVGRRGRKDSRRSPSSVRDTTPERAAGVTGVPADDIRRAARAPLGHRPGALLFAMGITQHTCGTANAFACTNLQLLLGNLGVPGAGVNPLRGQNNVQGACDIGALPDMLPGYQPVADEAARRRFAEAWGVALPAARVSRVTEMIDAALTGGIRGALHPRRERGDDRSGPHPRPPLSRRLRVPRRPGDLPERDGALRPRRAACRRRREGGDVHEHRAAGPARRPRRAAAGRRPAGLVDPRRDRPAREHACSGRPTARRPVRRVALHVAGRDHGRDRGPRPDLRRHQPRAARGAPASSGPARAATIRARRSCTCDGPRGAARASLRCATRRPRRCRTPSTRWC